MCIAWAVPARLVTFPFISDLVGFSKNKGRKAILTMNVLLLGAVLSLATQPLWTLQLFLVYLYSPVKHQDLKALVRTLSTRFCILACNVKQFKN